MADEQQQPPRRLPRRLDLHLHAKLPRARACLLRTEDLLTYDEPPR